MIILDSAINFIVFFQFPFFQDFKYKIYNLCFGITSPTAAIASISTNAPNGSLATYRMGLE